MALKASFLVPDLTTRVHGNTKHAPLKLLPGRYKKDNIQLLPSSTTKKVPQ